MICSGRFLGVPTQVDQCIFLQASHGFLEAAGHFFILLSPETQKNKSIRLWSGSEMIFESANKQIVFAPKRRAQGEVGLKYGGVLHQGIHHE